MLLSWLYCWGSRIINPTHGPVFFFFSACFNRLWINAKQMFGNTLMISCVSGTNSLSLSLSLLPPRQTRSQFTFRRVRLFYINRRPLWQGVWLGGGAQIPLKVHSSLARCLFEDRKSNKEGGDWRSVVVVLSVPNSVYAPTVKHRYHPAATSRSLPVTWAGTKTLFLPGVPKHVRQDRTETSLDMIESPSVTNTIKMTCCFCYVCVHLWVQL